MVDLLASLLAWLGSAFADGSALFVIVLQLAATLVLNQLTDASDPPRMAGNFASLALGASLGFNFFPDWSPPIELTANGTLALFSGMTAMGLINMALLRPL
ncbi:MAG: hypothetical protein ACOZAM_30205 [Pseudomonadota bacterium]